MEISDIPITEYLRLCLKTAEQRGFLWVMVLLARERDLPNGYADIKKYWNSYDDLTGDNILFLLTTSNDPRQHIESILVHEKEGYKRAGNSNLLIVNSKPLYVSEKDYPANAREYWMWGEALKNTSLHISPILRKYKLSERDIPAILLIPTMEHSSPVIIRGINDVYSSLRSLIIHLEPLLRKFDDCKSSMAKNRQEITDTDKAIQANNQMIAGKQIHKYLQFKEYVDNYLKELDSESRESLKSAIDNGDLRVCASFNQPLRAHLNRLIDMQTQNREIEISAKTYAERNAELSEKKKRLNCEFEEMGDNLFSLRKIIYDAAGGYCNMASYKEEYGVVHGSDQQFKISITFSGRYRDTIVRPTCEELLKKGFSKKEIFYDEWHAALINGIDGSATLQSIYYQKSDVVVVLLSPDYRERNWTGNVEWRAVLELINTGEGKRICLLAVGNVDLSRIEGLFATQAIYKSVDNMSPEEIADFICEYFEYKTK